MKGYTNKDWVTLDKIFYIPPPPEYNLEHYLRLIRQETAAIKAFNKGYAFSDIQLEAILLNVPNAKYREVYEGCFEIWLEKKGKHHD